jgi:hypothetical protein
MNKNNSSKTHRCPLDGRLFATKAALNQHKMAAHQTSIGNSIAPKPKKVSSPSSVMNETVVRLHRYERWVSVQMHPKADSVAGGDDVVFTGDSFPPVLKKMAAMFEMYIVHKVTVHFQSSTSNMKSGQLLLGVEYGSTKPAVLSKEGIGGLKHFMCKISESKSMALAVKPIERFVTPSDDNRDKPFRIMWWVEYPDGVKAGVQANFGELYITYDVTLKGLQA